MFGFLLARQQLTDNPPQEPIQIADRRSRRLALMIVSLALIIGLASLMLLEDFRSEWEGWLEREVARWISDPARGGCIMFLLSTPLYVFAWYLGRVAKRTEAARRWPPPGQAVVRDTPILVGNDAYRRGRLLRLAALLSWFLPILCGLWFWWALTSLGGAGGATDSQYQDRRDPRPTMSPTTTTIDRG